MAQHSGGIRRPRKSYLISLLSFPPFTLLSLSLALSHTFLSHPSFSPILLSPHIRSSSLFPHLLFPSFRLLFFFHFSYPSAILPTRSTLDSARAFATLSLSLSFTVSVSSLLIRTRIHAASTQPSTHSLARSFSRHFNIFFFFLSLSPPPLGFVCSSERTALHIYRHSSRGRVFTSLSRQRIFLPSHVYLFLFLLLPSLFLFIHFFPFFFFVSFKHRQVRYRITIVINFVSVLFCLLLIWSSNRTSSNPRICVCVCRNIPRMRVCLYVCFCHAYVYRVYVCICVKRCDERHLGRPACLRALAKNHRTLSSYSLIHEKNARRYVVNSLIYKKYVWGE